MTWKATATVVCTAGMATTEPLVVSIALACAVAVVFCALLCGCYGSPTSTLGPSALRYHAEMPLPASVLERANEAIKDANSRGIETAGRQVTLADYTVSVRHEQRGYLIWDSYRFVCEELAGFGFPREFSVLLFSDGRTRTILGR